MKPGPSYEISQSACPHCGHSMDMTFCTKGDHKPSEGDATLCIQCGGIAVFTKELTMREPTPEEDATISMLPDVIQSQIFIRGGRRHE